jgi:hypothetical protein
MKLLSAGAVIAAMAVVLWASTATARREPNNRAATAAYLRAKYAEGQAQAANPSAGLVALERLDKKLSAECPGVLVNAPKPGSGSKSSSSAMEIANEETSVIFGTMEHSEYLERARFARAVAHLSWSRRPLTELLRGHAAEEAAKAGVQLPHLCADLKAWVVSGYQTVSTGTKQYLHRLQVISQMTVITSEPGEPSLNFNVERIIAHRLAPYEDQADKAIIRRTEHVEKHPQGISRARWLARFTSALEKASHVLTTPPAPQDP